MNYTKKIAGQLRGYYVMKGITLAALIAALLQGMMIRAGVMTGYRNILIVWGGLTVIAIVLGLLVSFGKMRVLKKQIRRPHASLNFNEDHFTEYAKNLWLGREWLVYQKDLDYRIYHRSSIRRIQADAKRRGSLVRILCTEGTEGFSVNMNSGQLQNRLDEWLRQPE